MAKKKEKMKTPEWILGGYDSPAAYNKARQKAEPLASSSKSQTKGISTKKEAGKTFNIRECPKCGSDEVGVVIGESGFWECRKCKWKGTEIKEKELTEDELMEYLDSKGEDVA